MYFFELLFNFRKEMSEIHFHYMCCLLEYAMQVHSGIILLQKLFTLFL